MGAPLSVLPQQNPLCPHQPSDLSAASHSSGVGISRCHLPVQVLASSPDLPFSAHATQEPANLPKTFFLGLHPSRWSRSRASSWLPLLPRESRRSRKATDGEVGWPEGSARLRAGLGAASRQTHSTTQSVKAASEAGVKGEKQHLWQRSCLLPSFRSSRQDFGMETSAQTHPSPRHGQWVNGCRSGTIQ